MKQLRVLTGRHAGMDLVLNASTYRIFDDPDADIQIADWNEQTLDLTLSEDEHGMSTATYRLGPDSVVHAMADLVPRRFGDIVLCLGSAIGPAWPSDVELLGRVLTPPVSSTRTAGSSALPRSRQWAVWSLSVAVLAVGAAFVTVVSGSSRAASQVDQPSVLVRAQNAIERIGVPGLTVRVDGDGVLVEGLVATPNECAMVRAALSDLPPGAVRHRYAAASEVAQSIAEALSAPGIRVAHVAGGEFLVDGAAVGADGLQTAADRLVNDLAPLVRTIRVAVTDLPPPQRAPTGAMLHVAGMEYVQTRDGTKHISLLATPVLELNDSLGGSISPRAAGTHP